MTVSSRIPELTAINIEIAHVRSWEDPNALPSAEESMIIASEQCDARGIQFEAATLSVLVDDKAQPINDRAAWLRNACENWRGIFERVDFVCFESDLMKIADVFLARLRTQNRGRRAREIERYRNKHGRIACSHDIAVWHSFRLGRLGGHDELLVRPPCLVVSTGNTPRGFYAKQVMSILEDDDRDEEERARELMAEAEDEYVEAAVETIFYAP